MSAIAGRAGRASLAALILVLCSAARGFAAPPAGRLVLHDDLQRSVVVPSNPERVIALLPSLTEIVCALDACDRLVATGQFANWPEHVKKLPKVGRGLDDVGIERIVSLKPDLVLLSRSQRASGRLDDLGIVSFALDTDRYADIERAVRTIGELLGVPARAAALNAQIQRSVAAVSAEALARRHGDGASVYFEVDRGPYAAGPQSYIGELLSRLGVRNIVTPDLGPFPKLNPEYVVRRDPDVIFIAAADARQLGERPGWNRIRAVKEHRLCAFAQPVMDTIVRPGPRVADGMRAMAACLAQVAP